MHRLHDAGGGGELVCTCADCFKLAIAWQGFSSSPKVGRLDMCSCTAPGHLLITGVCNAMHCALAALAGVHPLEDVTHSKYCQSHLFFQTKI